MSRKQTRTYNTRKMYTLMCTLSLFYYLLLLLLVMMISLSKWYTGLISFCTAIYSTDFNIFGMTRKVRFSPFQRYQNCVIWIKWWKNCTLYSCGNDISIIVYFLFFIFHFSFWFDLIWFHSATYSTDFNIFQTRSKAGGMIRLLFLLKVLL